MASRRVNKMVEEMDDKAAGKGVLPTEEKGYETQGARPRKVKIVVKRRLPDGSMKTSEVIWNGLLNVLTLEELFKFENTLNTHTNYRWHIEVD